MSNIIPENIFNVNKQDYHNTPLFLGDNKGLLDSINKPYPELWTLYEKMRSLDWDANEFDYSSCLNEFKTCSPDIYNMMIKTLAWQWEADSMAAHNLLPIVAPFVSSSELWALWTRIADNELTHSLAYSEIVRNSFEDPDGVMTSIIEEARALKRLETVAVIFNNVYEVSHKLALGIISKNSDEAYDAIFIFVVTIYALERIQFTGSFAVTFAIVDTGIFLPIGKALQKICIDELEIHAKTGETILRIELNTERGKLAFQRNKELITRIVTEITNSELTWISGCTDLVGLTTELLEDWILYNSTFVHKYLGIENSFRAIDKNPLGFMNDWININNHQASAQEEKIGNYLLGGLVNNTGDRIYEVDF